MPTPNKIGTFELKLPGSETRVVINVQKSERSKNINLKIKNSGEITISVPASSPNSSLERAKLFALKNLDWIDKHLEKIKKRQAETPPKQKLETYLRENPSLFLRNTNNQIEIYPAPAKPFYVLRHNEGIVILGVRQEHIDSDLRNCLISLAKSHLPEEILLLAKTLKINIGKITIRDQHSRWGSCTQKGNLSLNWRLILLPYPLRNHIFLHELAHRKHMDHSDDFWDLLCSWDPHCMQHDREISKIWGPKIMNF